MHLKPQWRPQNSCQFGPEIGQWTNLGALMTGEAVSYGLFLPGYLSRDSGSTQRRKNVRLRIHSRRKQNQPEPRKYPKKTRALFHDKSFAPR
eukprot:859942-Amphidinium_carterae.2